METQERALSPPPPLNAVDSDSGGHVTGVQQLGVGESQDCTVNWSPMDQGSTSVEEDAALSSDADFLYNSLLDKIVRQVEYYLSDENLRNDKFLFHQIRKDKEGYVPLTVIASYKKMKKLTKNLSIIEAALRTSSLIVFSSDGKKVKQMRPLPLAEVKDVKPQTVLVENLPEDHSEDNIRRIFGTVGHIIEVRIHDPHSEEALANPKKQDLAISRKLHALIEYDTVQAAESAVSTLNDENNWSGIRVQLLLKIMEEKVGNVVGKGGRRRNKTRFIGQHPQPTDDQGYLPKSAGGQGHGSVPSGFRTEGGVTNKLIPGPRMPDGTRGFTMGRGRSILS